MINPYVLKKEIGSIAKEALTNYFQPITFAYKALNKTLRFEEQKLSLIHQNESSKNVIRVMHKAVCFNQGRYLEYNFIAAEKHRNLKDSLRLDKNNVENIAKLTKELVDFVNTKFYENTHENFKVLHAYFSTRKRPYPRICIKGSFRADNKSTVVSVFRDSLVKYDSNSEINKNSGFKSVYKNGAYFLENNIPKAAAEGRYFNPRLKQDCAKSYLGSKTSGKSAKWSDCWIGDKTESSSFYKSTMIIPMTLWNNKISDEFKDLINMSNVDRTIFGFLCFDHTEANYFNEEEDVPVGYVFADIMSMYVFTRLIYMEISKTFSEAEDWLSKKQRIPEPTALSTVWRSMPTLDPYRLLGLKVTKTKFNDLFPIDSDLLKFVESLNTPTNKSD